MSMTSRTSGTSRLERIAALRMVSSSKDCILRRDSGNPAGSFVYNADSWGISRYFRKLREDRGLLGVRFGGFSAMVPAKSATDCGAGTACHKNLGCYAGWCVPALILVVATVQGGLIVATGGAAGVGGSGGTRRIG